MALCVDMFFAGSDTTTNALCFAFLYFLRQPGVVKKIQDEIDTVVGNDRKVNLSDRPKYRTHCYIFIV
jgi:methyl farnesoate epoxidase / farnesoate epoxidase